MQSVNTEFNIPLAVITRIIAESVTDDISVQEDFIKALSRATSLFILYSTQKANEIASENNRRSVYSQDVLNAVSSLGFDHFIPDLTKWLTAFLEEKAESAVKSKKTKKTNEMEVEEQPEQQQNENE